jgi:hypothetical protein
MTLENINTILKSTSNTELQIKETDSDYGYILEGDATVVTKTGTAFQLNPPVKLVKLKKTHEYVDRYIVPSSAGEAELNLAARLLKGRGYAFKAQFPEAFFNTIEFEMPGFKSGQFARPVEGTEDYEIRYYIQVFQKEE